MYQLFKKEYLCINLLYAIIVANVFVKNLVSFLKDFVHLKLALSNS